MLYGLDAGEWTAVFAGLIALLALVVTLWQAVIARRHNLLSYRPVLDFEGHFVNDAAIGLELINRGPGLAFIKSFHAIFNKKKYDLFQKKSIDALMHDIGTAGVPFNSFFACVLESTSVLEAGGSRFLIRITDTDDRSLIAREFFRVMEQVRFEISYKSLYDEVFTTVYDRPVIDHH